MNRYKQCTVHEYDGRKVPPAHRVAPWSGPGRFGFKASRSRRARHLAGLLAAVVITACAILARAQTGEEYSLSQVTFSGGGGVSTSVEGYRLFTIIGEHTAGQASGDGYTMVVGSLPGLIDDQTSLIPDIDGDGDGDLRDVSIFQNCFHAELGAGDSGLCDPADLNGDDIVDFGDVPGLVHNMTGPR